MWTTPRGAKLSAGQRRSCTGCGRGERVPAAGFAPALGRPGGFLPWPTCRPARCPPRRPCAAEAHAATATWSLRPTGAAGRPAFWPAAPEGHLVWEGRTRGTPRAAGHALRARGGLGLHGACLGDRTPGGLPPAADVLPCATCGPLWRLPLASYIVYLALVLRGSRTNRLVPPLPRPRGRLCAPRRVR